MAGVDLTRLSPWVSVPAVFVVWVLFFFTLKKIVFALIRKFTAKTQTKLDDMLFGALDLPLRLMICATGVLAVQGLVPRGNIDTGYYLLGGFKSVAILSAVLFFDKFMRGLVTVYAGRIDILRTSSGVVQGFVRVVIMGLGALILLDSFGVSITPIIASLGIGSLAVALALQPTLENFFSGIQLVTDKPIQVGHFIRLESGEEGTVTKIGWRSTWICQPNNNTVVMPNKMLVNTRVLNYHYPDMETVMTVPVGVHYASDLEKVERVTLEVTRAVQKENAGGVPSFEPSLRYAEFADSSINFNVVLRAKDWSFVAVLRHDLIKALHKRYAVEGISIPYPTRTIMQG